VIERLQLRFDVEQYGRLDYGPENYSLMAIRSRDRVLMHIDLHETTDTDETEFRPALAARDG